MRKVPSSVRRVLEELRELLAERFGARLRTMILFGSYAQGGANEDSDVDVLVVVDELDDEDFGEVARAAVEVSLATGFDIAPLPLSTERHAALRAKGTGIASEIARSGIPL